MRLAHSRSMQERSHKSELSVLASSAPPFFSTLISATLRSAPRLGSRNSQHAIISPAQRLSLRRRINDDFVRLFEDEDLSVTRVSDRRQFPALLAQII